ncbi:MAG: hypothetical protein KDE58_03685, partial [Caldilineaceae bacterium]|nr:hypothetical protein [Caldilineaceae bacterium]
TGKLSSNPFIFSVTTWTESDETDPDAIMVAVDPEVEKGGELATDSGTWTIYGSEGNDTYNIYGVIVIDDQPYIVTTTTTDERLVTLMVEFILAPALRDFSVNE